MFTFTRCYEKYEKRDVFENETRREIKRENYVVFISERINGNRCLAHKSEINFAKTNSRMDERMKCVTMSYSNTIPEYIVRNERNV